MAATHHVADGVTGFAAEKPGREHGLRPLEQPRHHQGTSGYQEHDHGPAEVQDGLRELRLTARQTGLGAACRLPTHAPRLAEAEHHDVGRSRQIQGGADTARLVAFDRNARRVPDLAARQRLA